MRADKWEPQTSLYCVRCDLLLESSTIDASGAARRPARYDAVIAVG